MTISHPNVKHLVQVSEQVFDPIQVPVQVGGDMFILVQQDIRKIEEIRHLAYYKYEPNQEQENLNQNTNPVDTNHIWDNLTTAMLSLRSLETQPEKVNVINKLLGSLEPSNTEVEHNQMQWEPTYRDDPQQLQSPDLPFCNLESGQLNRIAQCICCCCTPPTPMRNRATLTCQPCESVEPEQNVREQMLRKKKKHVTFV